MTFQPVVRRSVPEDVYDQIAFRVVSGELPPGGTLPSERELAAALGVSRPAVREALKRLDAVGLVRVRQGDATMVRDIRRDGGLNLLPMLLIREGGLDLSVARSIVEARMHIGPKVAELAAERATEADVELLRLAAEALAAESDPVQQQVLALGFWDVIVDSADSIAYRLMFNTLRASYEPVLPVLSAAMSGEVGQPEAYGDVVEAISRRDVDAAGAAAHALLEPSTTALTAALIAMKEN